MAAAAATETHADTQAAAAICTTAPGGSAVDEITEHLGRMAQAADHYFLHSGVPTTLIIAVVVAFVAFDERAGIVLISLGNREGGWRRMRILHNKDANIFLKNLLSLN